MKITEPVLHVLGAAHPDGNRLYLASERLDSELYRQVADLLETAGGVWSKSVQGFVFPEGASAWDAVTDLAGREAVTTAHERKQDTQYYPTPPDVAEEMMVAARLSVQHTVLEPSAGTGAIASAVAEHAAAVDCIEKDPEYAAALQGTGCARKITVADFLTVPPPPPGEGYDRVLMNPPFTKNADITHVRHALRFVKPGGRLVAVMSAAVKTRNDKATKALRNLVEASCGWFTDLPDGAFKESGTLFSTVIAVIPVPEPGVHGNDTPVRVTTDLTAAWLMPFDPVTAKPGVYINDDFGSCDRVFRYHGTCVSCGARTWRHDDGDDDPRGVFENNLSIPVRQALASMIDGEIPDDVEYSCCAGCYYGSRETYERAVRQAARMFRRDRAARRGLDNGADAVAVVEKTQDDAGQLTLFPT